jgi:hypothetical protein
MICKVEISTLFSPNVNILRLLGKGGILWSSCSGMLGNWTLGPLCGGPHMSFAAVAPTVARLSSLPWRPPPHSLKHSYFPQLAPVVVLLVIFQCCPEQEGL